MEDERLSDLKAELDSLAADDLDDLLYDLMVALYPSDEAQDS